MYDVSRKILHLLEKETSFMSNTLADADIAVLQQNTEMLKYDTILYISNSSFGITDHR